MKLFRSLVAIVILLLSGCTSAHNSQESTWWNPVSWHWSALWPSGWFTPSLVMSEQGVGDITGLTPMTRVAINQGLKGNYHLRQGMRAEQGKSVFFWQALKNDRVKLTVSGEETVNRIIVTDTTIAATDGSRIGDKFSARYQQAFGHCRYVADEPQAGVSCQAPGSQHIYYLYQGEWSGPAGLIPPDDLLKNWTISKLIWQR